MVRLTLALTGLVGVAACGPASPDASGTTAASTGPASAGGTSETGGVPTTETTPTGTAATEPDSDSTGADSTGSSGSSSSGGEQPPGCAYTVVPVAGLVGDDVVAADFDQDGAMDIAAQPMGGAVQLFFGDGSGEVYTPGPVADLGDTGKMLGGDFDGDGRPDLLHYDLVFAQEIRVQLNLGGVLGPPISRPTEALYYTARVADVDADGDSDFSFGGLHSDPVHVLLSEAGVWTDAHQLAPAACYATGSSWADLDGDGDLDFAVVAGCNAVPEMSGIAVHLRDGAGFTAIAAAGITHAADPPVLEAGDFDGDGNIDVVVQGFDGPLFERHLGLGDGLFAAREAFPLPAETWVYTALDADGDGRSDLLTSSAAGVTLLRSTGPGFEPCAVGPGQAAAVADFDGDGALDVLLADGDGFALARTS